MKKLAILVILPAVAWAASPFTSTFKPGKYQGSYTSIVPQLNGQKCSVELKNVQESVEATVTCGEGATASKEVWKWNEKTLTQQEIDPKTGKVVQEYGATASVAPAGTSQTWTVNCKDKAANVCDAQIDWRNNWTIRTTPTGIEYVVSGIPSAAEKTNPTAKTVERHKLSLSVVK